MEIVTLTGRPDLAPTVAGWRFAAFGQGRPGRTVERSLARLLAPKNGPEETFILLDDGIPAGTAGLSHDDLDARPDLTPWLAGVVVQPAYRGRGHASALVRAVEAYAATRSVPELWLYTWSAEPLYARLGWTRAGVEQSHGEPVVLMHRHLTSTQADT